MELHLRDILQIFLPLSLPTESLNSTEYYFSVKVKRQQALSLNGAAWAKLKFSYAYWKKQMTLNKTSSFISSSYSEKAYMLTFLNNALYNSFLPFLLVGQI